MKIHDMESHPAADIFPMMSGEEFEALKDDMEEHGQMEPIVLDEDDRILDGRNRYKAAVDLGWSDDDIDFVGYEGDSPVTYVISMNLKRRHLNESQRAMVAAKAQSLYQEEASKRMKSGKAATEDAKGPAREHAARTVNVSARSVSSAAQVLKTGSDKLISAVDGGSIAVDSARLIVDRDPDEQDELVDLVASGTAKNLRQAIRMHDEALRVARAKKSGKKSTTLQVLEGDALEVMPTLKKSTIALALFDPPYGIETHSTRRGGKDYADGEEYIRELLPATFLQLKRVLKADAHGYCFAGYTWAWLVKQLLSEVFIVQDNPIIWVKDNHTMCDFAQAYPNKHEYVWHFKMAQGKKRKLRACIPDVIEVARTNVTTHSAEKPINLLKKLIEQSTEPGELVLDMFVGGGSTLVACAETKRSGIGIELDPKWADVARSRL